jgi:hypothetical protein
VNVSKSGRCSEIKVGGGAQGVGVLSAGYVAMFGVAAKRRPTTGA